MTQRLDYWAAAPKAMEILLQQEAYLSSQFESSESLTPTIWELIKLRVSQINQCAFCIEMHSNSALEHGETVERLMGVSAWSEMPYYSNVERAAFQWAESLTLNAAVDEREFEEASRLFTSSDLVNLTIAVNAINSWNRVAKTFKPEIGSYKAG